MRNCGWQVAWSDAYHRRNRCPVGDERKQRLGTHRTVRALAVSEYGASIWCDPHLWIPEAYRLLRPGGKLWFLRNSTLSIMCAPDVGPPTGTLQRPQRGLGRLESPGELAVEWQLPHGEMFRLLRRTGFDVVDLVELYPPDGAVDHAYYTTFSVDWARKWPCEEIWVAQKRR